MAFKYLNDATIGAGQITSNVLPAAANVADGTFAYDSVVGPVFARSGNWLGVASGIFAPSVLTAAGIQAVMAAAGAAGGGIVQLPSGVIPLSASLTPVNGVYLVGVEPVLNTSTGIPDAPSVTFTSGTILAPTGAFPAITWNTATLGVPASQAAFGALGLNNIGFKNLGFSGGTYGIFGGGTNNASCWWSEFENLYFIGQTVWGLWLSNYQHCHFGRNYSFNCINGQWHGIDVAAGTLSPGNSTYYDLYNVIPSSSATNWASRGIAMQCTNGGISNQFKMDRIQSNRFNAAPTTQAATMANTSANVTVADGTKFLVDLPVAFSVTANGVTAGTIYFITSVAANVVQVSKTLGGVALVMTGATAINITHNGFPAFEFVGRAGSSMTNGVITNLDVEAGGTCAVLFQNATGCDVTVSQVPQTGQSTVSICGRNVVGTVFRCGISHNTDFDTGFSNVQSYGVKNYTSVGTPGAGIAYDTATGNVSLSLGAQGDTTAAGALVYIPTGSGLVQGNNIAERGRTNANAAPADSILGGQLSYTAASTVITLPVVTATTVGMCTTYVNQTATTQTINTNGVQLFNGKAALTSLTLGINASVRIKAAIFSAGVFGYTIEGYGGTYSAGVITGL